jgi:hypothetical protein
MTDPGREEGRGRQMQPCTLSLMEQFLECENIGGENRAIYQPCIHGKKLE